MSFSGIIDSRLHTQRLLGRKFTSPAEVVAFFGAVQGQDLLASLWALGQRVTGATEATIDAAIADGSIVRTWPMRGTIHYVAAADVHWLLKLTTAPRPAVPTSRHRELGLDQETFDRSRDTLVAALSGGRRLERHAAYKVLEEAGISTEGQRGIHILGQLALDGVLCIGPRQGKQPTFVLMDEWVPNDRELPRDEALAELARRYFTSHGPATAADFTWWSGLSATEARRGLASVAAELTSETIDGVEHWSSPQAAAPQPATPRPFAHLLPVYDEYMVAYKDRSAGLPAEFAARPDAGNGIFRPPILIDGRVAGTWTRQLKKGRVVISTNLFRALAPDETAALSAAATRYADFLGLAAEIA